MAATGRTASFLHQSSRMKSPQLILATIAVSVSSSWSGNSSRVLMADAFSARHQRHHSSSHHGAFGHIHHRSLHLPPRNSRIASSLSDDDVSDESRQSVTGPIYEQDGVPTVKLFTKEGCTLCDKVKDVLESIREDQPHSLLAVDITDDDKQEWFSKYKWDIPVLHINDIYWTKHRLSAEEAVAGIKEAQSGNFAARQGEPDASRLEHN